MIVYYGIRSQYSVIIEVLKIYRTILKNIFVLFHMSVYTKQSITITYYYYYYYYTIGSYYYYYYIIVIDYSVWCITIMIININIILLWSLSSIRTASVYYYVLLLIVNSILSAMMHQAAHRPAHRPCRQAAHQHTYSMHIRT